MNWLCEDEAGSPGEIHSYIARSHSVQRGAGTKAKNFSRGNHFGIGRLRVARITDDWLWFRQR